MNITKLVARILIVVITYSITFILPVVSYWLLPYQYHTYWSLFVGLSLVLVLCSLYPWYWFRASRRSMWKTLTCATTSITLLFFYYSLVYPLAYVLIDQGRIPPANLHVMQIIAFSIISILLALTAAWCSSRLKTKNAADSDSGG